ncbi:MAG TPA: hypothetical protein VGT41_03105 [Candidatus Babeliales bacterium]|nr:hypothetical protein [Candidatus Babeliales bacterium]
MKKNLLISIATALLAITIPNTTQTAAAEEAPKLLSATKLSRASVSCGGIPLYISEKELDDAGYDIEKLFKIHDIHLSSTEKIIQADDEQAYWPYWADKYKKRIASNLLKKTYEININDIPQLLATARSTIKSFLLTDDAELPLIEKLSIRKKGINRLLTYAALQQVIEEKQLSHIRLPRKIAVIHDNETGEYVPAELAQKIIDIAINAEFSDGRIIIQETDGYDFIIFAHKEKHYNRPLSKQAYDDLVQLISEAPFDVGAGNIFTDQNGDAVIIDTEFKGEPAETSIKKLSARYDIDFKE